MFRSKSLLFNHTVQHGSLAICTVSSPLQQYVPTQRAVAGMLLSTATAVGVLAGTAVPIHAEPSITAVLVGGSSGHTSSGGTFVENGNFAIQGSGFTPGNTRVNVWLTDHTTNRLLWYTPEAYAFPNGVVGVTGPMRYAPASGLFPNTWSPEVNIPCGHNVRAIAKDGDYNNPNAMWTKVSDNISEPCPPPPR